MDRGVRRQEERQRAGFGAGVRAVALLAALAALSSAAHAQRHLAWLTAGYNASGMVANPVTNRIYVASYGENKLTVINGSDNTTATVTIPGGWAQSDDIAVNTVTNRIYVMNRRGTPSGNPGSVTVVNGADNSVITDVPVGEFPLAIAVNEATNKVYVACCNVADAAQRQVWVIDGATHATTQVPVGPFAKAIAVNPVTNRIYVANGGATTVTVIDGATDTVLTTVDISNTPEYVAINRVTNKIYVARFSSPYGVAVIDGATNATTFVAGQVGPSHVAINETTNRIYVINSGGSVTVINGASDSVITTINNSNSGANFSNPRMAAVNPATNRIYVVNAGNTSMTVVNGVDNSARNLLTGLLEPRQIALNPATNRIYAGTSDDYDVAVLFGAESTRRLAYLDTDSVLWRNTGNGTAFVWDMDWNPSTGMPSIYAASKVATVSEAGWQIVGTGDFNGNRQSDILWKNSDGRMRVWLLGTSLDSGANVNRPVITSSGAPAFVPDANWQVQGVGDFNGDGKADVLWRHAGNGAVLIWLMNGATIIGLDSPTTVADPQWQIQGVGDFDGDAKADILWRKLDTGRVDVWRMNGTAIASSGTAAIVPPGSNWQVQGIGDLDGDGKSDVLWRRTDTGAVLVWKMNGTAIAGTGSLPTVPVENWTIRGVADYNGDGRADILWRHEGASGTGTVRIWYIGPNGTSIASSGPAATVPLNLGWEIQNTR
jgi:YVTN family beta-propeller protein